MCHGRFGSGEAETPIEASAPYARSVLGLRDLGLRREAASAAGPCMRLGDQVLRSSVSAECWGTGTNSDSSARGLATVAPQPRGHGNS